MRQNMIYNFAKNHKSTIKFSSLCLGILLFVESSSAMTKETLKNIKDSSSAESVIYSPEKDSELIRPEQKEIQTYKGKEIIDERYFLTRVPTSKDNEFIWHRAMSSENSEDPKVLAIGYENIPTIWGDEGENIFFNSPKSTKTVFLSGGIGDNPKRPVRSALEKRVSAEKYNHIYADFYTLSEDVPYMINSHFFDYILIGYYTEIYITRAGILTSFYNMLNDNGRIIIPARKDEERLPPLKDYVFPNSESDLYISQGTFFDIFNTARRYHINKPRSKNVKSKEEYEIWSAELKAKAPIFETFFSNPLPYGYITIKRK